MTEPVYRWEPVTDLYKEQTPESGNIEAVLEAERQKKLQELQEESRRRPRTETKAPLGVRLFTWYYFCRSSVCFVLLCVIVLFPKAGPSIWLSDGISNFLKIPGSKSQQEARRKQIEQIAQTYDVPEDAVGVGQPLFNPETMRAIVIGYLAFSFVVAGVVGFMWSNRSWNVRWVTMFYAGALVAKVAVNMFVGTPWEIGSGMDPSQMPTLILTVGLNALVFLYLAFWPGVEQWFETDS